MGCVVRHPRVVSVAMICSCGVQPELSATSNRYIHMACRYPQKRYHVSRFASVHRKHSCCNGCGESPARQKPQALLLKAHTHDS
jgi:hypothetical protein